MTYWLIYYYCWICLYYWYFVAVLAVLATTILSAFYSCCITCTIFFYAFCLFACAVYFWFLLHSWPHCLFCLCCYAFLTTKALKTHLVCSFIARAVIEVTGYIAETYMVYLLFLFIRKPVVECVCSKFEDCFEGVEICFFLFGRLVVEGRVWVIALLGKHFIVYAWFFWAFQTHDSR